jgi:hypothetical protein
MFIFLLFTVELLTTLIYIGDFILFDVKRTRFPSKILDQSSPKNSLFILLLTRVDRPFLFKTTILVQWIFQ